MTPIEFSSSWNESDLKAVSSDTSRFSVWIELLLWSVALVLTAYLTKKEGDPSFYYFIILTVEILQLFRWGRLLRPRKNAKQTSTFARRPFSIEINDTGLRIQNDLGNWFYSWKGLDGYKELPSAFRFDESRSPVAYVMKRNLNDAQITNLREFLNSIYRTSAR